MLRAFINLVTRHLVRLRLGRWRTLVHLLKGCKLVPLHEMLGSGLMTKPQKN